MRHYEPITYHSEFTRVSDGKVFTEYDAPITFFGRGCGDITKLR